MPDGEVEVYAQSRDHEDRDGEQQQHHDRAGVICGEMLGAVPQAADDEGKAQNEEHVGDNRSDERGLYDADEAGAKREDAEEELRKVAESRLDDTGHPGAETIPEAVDAPSDDGGKHPERNG